MKELSFEAIERKGEKNAQQHSTTTNTAQQHSTTTQINNNIINKDCLIIIKNGKFYNVYHDDAIIFNYLFDYKIIEKDNKTGFPETVLTKVLNKLEELKINYEIIYKDQNPITKKFSNLNQYHRILSKSLNYQDLKIRINRIIDIINNIDDIDIINDILNVIENVTTNKLKAPSSNVLFLI